MHWPEHCAAVIPCYNEAAAIGSVVTQMRRHLPTVIVVDDGSTDDTAALAKAAGAMVINQPENLGKGAALRAGWTQARTLGFAWVLNLDGDGQHNPDEAPLFFSAAERELADLVIGNRMELDSDMPWLRRKVNRWMSRELSRLAGCELPDTQSGYRLMRLAAWGEVPLQTDRFEIESELLLAFVRAGRQVSFVPVSVKYLDEQSKIHPWHDTVRWCRWWRGARRVLQRR